MNLTVNEKSAECINFTLKNSSIAFANSLRRVLLSEIPSLSIDFVELEKNYSMIPDEILTHRLGMIPLKSSMILIDKNDCNCTSHCRECAIEGYLDVENREPDAICVTAQAIKFKVPSVCESEALIAKLGENQSIKCRVIVRKGIGMDHSKYCPVTAVSFEYDEMNTRRDVEFWDDTKAVKGDVDMDYLKKPTTIRMEVEVVDNTIEPSESLKVGLNILKKKVDRLLKGIEIL